MIEKTLERRVDLLKLEGNGMQPPEIVKELSTKYGVTQRSIYLDFERRNSWQPQLERVQQALLKICSRHEQLYRKAMIAYMQAKSERTRVSALNLLRQINVDLAELSGAKSQKSEETEETIIRWEEPNGQKEQ